MNKENCALKLVDEIIPTYPLESFASGNILYFISLFLLQELYSSVRSHFVKHSLEVKSMKRHYKSVFVNQPPYSQNSY